MIEGRKDRKNLAKVEKDLREFEEREMHKEEVVQKG